MRYHENRWLAEMGYATLVKVLRAQWPNLVAFPIEPTLEALPLEAQQAWIATAAAIRRRVVAWKLSAEEESHGEHEGAPDVPRP